MAIGENSLRIFNYVKEHDGEQMTAADIAEALGITPASVNGSVTAFQKKKFMERIEAEIEVTKEDGTVAHKLVKFISLTDAGREYDPTATAEAAE